VGGGHIGGVQFGLRLGVILHQPLSLTKKRKKRVFGQIMNGPPVCLGQKTENAPTWRPQNTNFGARFLPVLARYFEAANVCPPPFIIFNLHTINTTQLTAM